jgi:serine/threonine protein kinase
MFNGSISQKTNKGQCAVYSTNSSFTQNAPLTSFNACSTALSNYIKSRLNGMQMCNPLPFPSAGIESLKVKKSACKLDSKLMKYWPDNNGRYWWRLTLEDGSINEDFYWEKDEKKGWPDKTEKERYWFVIYNKLTQIEVAGFCYKADKKSGFPDRDGLFHRYVQFFENNNIKKWMDQNERIYQKQVRFGSVSSLSREISFSKIYKGQCEVYSTNPSLTRLTPVTSFRACVAALENYIENKLSDGGIPIYDFQSFPDAGIRKLKVRLSEAKPNDENGANYYPDKLNRYWWRLTSNDNNVIDNFYWTKDEWPDKNSEERHWFTIHYAPTGEKIKGFCYIANEEKGFPDHDGRYHRYVQYIETDDIRVWMELNQKNYLGKEKQRKVDIKIQCKDNPEESLMLNMLDLDVAREQDLLLKAEDIDLGRELGRGGFGIVNSGVWQGVEVAVKRLLEKRLNDALQAEFRHETAMMAKLRHPNVISLYGIVLNPECAMVIEYMARGSLYDVLHSEEALSWRIRYQIGVDATKGLVYLHSKRILHRDLKSLNVLLDKDYKAKLSDFGLSRIKSHTTSQSLEIGRGGTIPWMAPELVMDTESAKYTPECDVYSLGIVYWELIAREVPYMNLANPALIPIHVGFHGKRERIPLDTPEPLRKVTEDCWLQEPKARPTAKEALDYLTAHEVMDNRPVSSPHVKDKTVVYNAPSSYSSSHAGISHRKLSAQSSAASSSQWGSSSSSLSSSSASMWGKSNVANGYELDSAKSALSEKTINDSVKDYQLRS